MKAITIAAVLACVACQHRPLYAQVASLAPIGKPQYFDNNGIPLSFGRVGTYAAGTSTPLASFTDSTGGTSNTNPVILDASGRANIWLTSGVAYKIVLQSSTNVTIWTVDNVLGIGGGSGGGGGGGGSNFWTAAGTAIFNNNSSGTGYVGIGTNGATSAPLHVLGATVATNHILRLDDTGGLPGVDLYASGSRRATLTAPPSTALRVGDSADVALFTILQNGRVGIGLTAPTQILDVTGNVNITGNIVISGTCTVASVTCGGGGGSGYSIIEDESTPLTARTKLNFIGAGVTCVDNGGTTTTDCTITGGSGGFPVTDNTSLFDNNADNTKVGKFDLSGLTTGTTRTLKWQDANYTIAGINVAETFTSAQTFNANILTSTTGINIGATGNPFQDEFFKQAYVENLRIASIGTTFGASWRIWSDVTNSIRIEDNGTLVEAMDCTSLPCVVHLLGTTNVKGTSSGTLYSLQVQDTNSVPGINFFSTTSTKVGSISSGASAALSVQDQGDVFRFVVLQNGNTQVGQTTDQGFKFYVNGNTFINGNLTCSGTCGSGGGSGANTSLSNLVATAVNADITPGVDGARNIGTSALRFLALEGTTVAARSAAGSQERCQLGAGFGMNCYDSSGTTRFSLQASTGLAVMTGTSSGTIYTLGVRDTSGVPGINFWRSTSVKAGSLSSGATAALGVQDQSDVTRFVIFQNGDTQIGITTDQGYKFYVNGNSFIAGNLNVSSTFSIAGTAGLYTTVTVPCGPLVFSGGILTFKGGTC